MTFRTAADSDRVHARKGERGEKTLRAIGTKVPSSRVAANPLHAPVHRRVREYYVLSPSAMDRPSNASNLRLLLLFNGNTLRRAMPGIEAGNGAERRIGIDDSAMEYK